MNVAIMCLSLLVRLLTVKTVPLPAMYWFGILFPMLDYMAQFGLNIRGVAQSYFNLIWHALCKPMGYQCLSEWRWGKSAWERGKMRKWSGQEERKRGKLVGI